jgi:hypothetical protein
MEGENRLLGDPAARSRSRLAQVEEAGRKTCLGERRGKAPRPPLNAASAAMGLAWLAYLRAADAIPGKARDTGTEANSFCSVGQRCTGFTARPPSAAPGRC